MPTEKSSPEKWRLRRNTQVKHDILSEYLKRFIAVLSGGSKYAGLRTLHYVDSMAGRGRYSEGEPGSPLIAMEVGQELSDFREGGVHLNCYNVEHDPENFESLEREVEAVRHLYPAVEPHNYFGPFQDHTAEILRLIPLEEYAFIFIDPFGYRGIELQEVLKFLERRRSEVFITFQSHYIGRYVRDPSKASAMDAIFDTDEWRDLVDSPIPNQQAGAVELYGKQLQKRALERGKEVYVFPINVEFEDRAADIYHLVHVAQHPKARLVMEAAVEKVKRLSAEQPLFISPEVQEYTLEVLLNAPGRRMSALNLAGKVWLRFSYASWRNDIKEAIRELERTGEVGVRPHDDRNRKTGIEEKDVVFLRSGR